MPIEFTCRNEQCRKQLRAPNVRAGRERECEFCGKVQIVPAGQGATITLTSGQEELEEQAAVMKPVRSAGVIDCGQCGRGILATDQLCPDCGWVNAELLERRGPIDPEDTDAPEARLRVIDCLGAPFFAFTCVKALLVMVLLSLVAFLLLGMLIINIQAIPTGLMGLPGGFFVFTSMFLSLPLLLMAGCVLRYHTNIIVATLVSTGVAPNPIELMFRKSIAAGIAGVELAVVYVTPVITLPLLPLGLIALSQTDDHRALDVRWALRAAAKFPAHLAAVWALAVAWFAAATLVIYLLYPYAIYGEGGLGVGWATTILIPLLVHPLLCASSRCIGLMARARSDIIDSLPQRPVPAALIGAIIGGIAVTYVVWGLVLPAIVG